MEQIKSFKILPEEAINIRTKVFVEEQGFKEEFDTIDKIAEHLILFVDDNPIGTCRYYKKDDSYYFGRLAI
ncbi:MAG: GNAT family N-acetyltransferase, partial [Firmicutes bacterium]|nr:GNAT family N-acetyltransferase [Candidatus Onthovivens merdipullorum]